MDRVSMIEIYNVGKFFTHLYRSRPDDARNYKRRFDILAAAMRTCGLSDSENSIGQIDFDPQTENFSEAELTQIRQRSIGMDKAIVAEVSSKYVLLLPEGVVTPSLAVFSRMPQLLYDQSALVAEVEICIHAGAYRSAIVTTWNVFYDYVRQWVFNNKLAEFNAGWATRYKPPKPPIAQYTDFFKPTNDAPSERTFLDLCKGPALGTTVTTPMIRLLDERNQYAHPNFKTPTLNQANRFVEDCATILDHTPFV
jgi:hypothetical protein